MAEKKCPDKEFVTLFQTNGASETARILGIEVRAVYSRRRRLEKLFGVPIVSPHDRSQSVESYPVRIPIEIPNGIVMIGSDAHYWPGEATTAHRGFVHLIKKLKPEMVILNGDVLDGARISRHPRIGFARAPTLREEMDACEERTDEILDASKKAKHYWLLGNHCMRFENRLSGDAGEFEGVSGFQLKEHFPQWDFGLSLWINNEVVVKHRFKGGIHATHNNTMWSGKSIVTGHLHSLKVTPFADYNGNRFGIDTGTLSEPYGEHAAYGEDNPLNHRSGFIVLTFKDGKLLWPEVAHVISKNEIEFRGEIIKV